VGRYTYQFTLNNVENYYFPEIRFRLLPNRKTTHIQIRHPLDNEVLSNIPAPQAESGTAFLSFIFENLLVAQALYHDAMDRGVLFDLPRHGPLFGSDEYNRLREYKRGQMPEHIQMLAALWICQQEGQHYESEVISISDIVGITGISFDAVQEFFAKEHPDLVSVADRNFLVPIRSNIEVRYRENEPNLYRIITLVFGPIIIRDQIRLDADDEPPGSTKTGAYRPPKSPGPK